MVYQGVYFVEKSMTHGSEWKQLLLFTLPIMAGPLLQQLYSAVDGIVVGNFVSEDALSAVGTCTPVTLMYIAVALGLSSGCAIVVAQYFGAKQTDEMRRAVSTSLILMVGVGAACSVAGPLTARWILGKVLAVDPLLLDDAAIYLIIYCAGLVLQMTYNGVAAVLRSLGDARATLYFLLVSSVGNILLDVLFVVAFHWGVAGAAIATVIAQGVSAVISLIYMFRKYAVLRFSRREFRFHKDMGLLALRLAVPTMLQQLVLSFGNLLIQRMVNHFGRVTMAAFTAGMRIENFAYIPIFSFNASAATFSGQNIGAGKLDRVARGVKVSTAMCLAACAAIGLVLYGFAGPLVGLFGVSGAALGQGVEYLRFLSPFLLVFSVYMTVSGVLQGAGDVVFTASNTLLNLVIRCILAYVMGYLTPIGYRAIWFSLPLGWTISTVLTLVRYRRGPWRKKAVVQAQSQDDSPQ